MLAFLATAAAAFPLFASALTITSPNGAGWPGNTTVQVAWTWNQDDPNFSIELGNPTIQSGLLAQGPIAVANNINPNINSLSFELPVLPPGPHYFVAFVAIDDVNNVYANSSSFNIFDNPHSSATSITSTSGTPGTTKSSTSAVTSTRRNSTTSGTATSTGSVVTLTTTSSSEQITTLQITTATSSASTSTTSSGAAARGVDTKAFGLGGLMGVAAFVGAVVLGA